MRASDYGAAVRSGPIALVHAADANASRVLAETVRGALLTHRGATGVAGAVAIAAAVGYLVRCASTGSLELDKPAFLDFVATAISQLEQDPTPTRRPPVRKIFLRDRLRRIESWLGREPVAVFERTWTGAAALESVPAAIYCFLRTPERPIEALRTAANATHETAAIGAMTGTLAGAWLGADRIRADLPSWWAIIERRDELLALADELVDTALDLSGSEPPPHSLLG
jgi:ADP-ribosylglycohydrolase